jgi:hypothetical protein
MTDGYLVRGVLVWYRTRRSRGSAPPLWHPRLRLATLARRVSRAGENAPAFSTGDGLEDRSWRRPTVFEWRRSVRNGVGAPLGAISNAPQEQSWRKCSSVFDRRRSGRPELEKTNGLRVATVRRPPEKCPLPEISFQRPFEKKRRKPSGAYLTIITGQSAVWATFWLTLPITAPRMAPSPRLPMTIRSALSFRAMASISATGSPSATFSV